MSRRSGRSLTFKDAVRLLDDGSPFVHDLDALIGATFDAIPAGNLLALPYFAFRRKLVEYGEKVVGGIHDHVDGVGRYDRTQRLYAAHMVIVMASFADALDEIPDSTNRQLKRSAETTSILEAHEKLVRTLGEMDTLDPSPGRIHEIDRLYIVLTEDVGLLLATWGLENTREMRDTLLEHAKRRYEENFRRLAVQVPEFQVWAYLAEHAATRDAVRKVGEEIRAVGDELRAQLVPLTTGLAAVPELLSEVSGRAATNRVRTGLANTCQEVLKDSVLREAHAPDGVVLPTLERGYVNPAVRAAVTDSDSRPSEDRWWDEQPQYDDIQALLIGELTAPSAVSGPLVILGQPGAGKSILTRILSARLSDRGFLPVRVELRNVPADAEVQVQVEHAIHATTGRSVEWPDLADQAHEDGLLPLIILDGFDELLQATGVNRSDYLEQVANFQQRELGQRRPVAAIVTSRTAVADRARFPKATMTLRIEPFDAARVKTWLGAWNEANEWSLDAETMLRYGELAEQPLLLTLLALYDAGTGVLTSAEAGLDLAELYDRLLSEFARREVRKIDEGLDPKQERQEIAKELHRLETVALAMFNRHAKAITGEDLDRDLAVLLPDDRRREPGGNSMAKPLTAAQLTIGRFFFVHESSARRSDETEHAYEFLHATFGEFLAARYVVETLRSLARLREFQQKEGMASRLDDGKLWAALSFAALTGSKTTVEFTEGLLVRLPENERAAVRELTVELLHGAEYSSPQRSLTEYAPVRMSVFRRYVCYSANLVLLALLVTGEPLDFHPDDLLAWWPALQYYEFAGMRDAVRVLRIPNVAGYANWIVREDGSDVDAYESGPLERLAGAPPDEMLDFVRFPADSEAGLQIRSQAFISRWDNTLAALLPYFKHAGEGLSPFFVGDQSFSLAMLLIDLRFAPFAAQEPARRYALYRRIFGSARMANSSRWLNLVFRQLREDIRELDPSDTVEILRFSVDADAADRARAGFRDAMHALRGVDEAQFRGLVRFDERIRELLEGDPDAP